VTASNLRHGARAVILDADDRIFLLHCELPHLQFWLAPGGGVEQGETPLQALERELDEELGLKPTGHLPPLWHQVVIGENFAPGYDGVINDYFLVRVESFAPGGPTSEAELLVENITGHRWWTLEELLLAHAQDGQEVFSPRDLPVLLRQILADGPPASPLLIAF
jgi:8-oxo-dGTP pyrophosphatase MutT (NUDIX family)